MQVLLDGVEPRIWVNSQREKSVDYALFIPVTAPAGMWSPCKMCVGENRALANEPRAGVMLIAIVQTLVVSSLSLSLSLSLGKLLNY